MWCLCSLSVPWLWRSVTFSWHGQARSRGHVRPVLSLCSSIFHRIFVRLCSFLRALSSPSRSCLNSPLPCFIFTYTCAGHAGGGMGRTSSLATAGRHAGGAAGGVGGGAADVAAFSAYTEYADGGCRRRDVRAARTARTTVLSVLHTYCRVPGAASSPRSVTWRDVACTLWLFACAGCDGSCVVLVAPPAATQSCADATTTMFVAATRSRSALPLPIYTVPSSGCPQALARCTPRA